MRKRLRSVTSVCVLLLLGCSDERPRLFTDGDAATPDGGMCTSNAQCDDGVACTRDLCLVGGVCEHMPTSAACMTPTRCTRAADCDDRVACTRDTCLVDGTCGHTPQNDMCTAGQTCDLMRGCSSGSTPGTCRADADCRDAYDCTVDSCGVDGRCVYTAQNSRCSTGQVCRVGMGCLSERACSRDSDCDDGMRCNGAERCAELACIAGTPANCDVSNACTMDACVETGAMMCTHTMNPTCTGMVRSGIFNVAVPGSYSCGGGQVQVSVMQLLFSVSGTSLTVTPTPRGPAMMGTITGNSFTVRVTIGMPSILVCAETYQLTGTFTDANHFTGTYSLSFAPAEICVLAGCGPHSFPVSGTAM